ncbi:MAG: hypothetical protein BroJett040_04460 [Oligoflexia bacterium]|nr:MAG: hypothetical protein BroJett040_04460 [Oligoflexia bacterium]
MAVDPSNLKAPSQYTSLRKVTTAADQDKRLREVADLYEKQFMREMMKAMRGTVQESGLVKVGQAEKIFREELDGEHVNNWSKQGGLGLSKVIYDQLIEKYGARLGIKSPELKPQGPIPLDEKSQFTGSVKTIHSGPKVSYQFSREESVGPESLQRPQLMAVKAPWDGSILQSQRINADEYVLDMLHDNGLKSQFVFRGQPQPGLAQRKVQGGETIGLLSPEAKQFFWNIEPTVSE